MRGTNKALLQKPTQNRNGRGERPSDQQRRRVPLINLTSKLDSRSEPKLESVQPRSTTGLLAPKQPSSPSKLHKPCQLCAVTYIDHLKKRRGIINPNPHALTLYTFLTTAGIGGGGGGSRRSNPQCPSIKRLSLTQVPVIRGIPSVMKSVLRSMPRRTVVLEHLHTLSRRTHLGNTGNGSLQQKERWMLPPTAVDLERRRSILSGSVRRKAMRRSQRRARGDRDRPSIGFWTLMKKNVKAAGKR